MTEIKQNNRIQQLETLLAEDENDSFIIFALAKEYEKLEELEKATEILESLHSKDPNYVGLYYHLGTLYHERSLTEKAIQICQEGIDICKSLGDLHALSELQNLKMNIEIE